MHAHTFVPLLATTLILCFISSLRADILVPFLFPRYFSVTNQITSIRLFLPCINGWSLYGWSLASSPR